MSKTLSALTLTVAACIVTAIPATAQVPLQPLGLQNEVMQVDEAYRVAKLGNDLGTLSRILADNFFETNQNGHRRDKAQSLELWKTFKIDSLSTDTFEVRSSGNTAVVTGTQTEDGADRMVFARSYVKTLNNWQLLESIQFRNPAAEIPLGIHVQNEVMKVDEEFRQAKLNNDTSAMARILSDSFYQTNQNGNARDKAQTIELWRTFKIASLINESIQVRMTSDTAVVTGSQIEDKTDRMLFSRVYVKEANGWRLLSSMQFRANE